MKKSTLIAPTILSLLTLVIAPKASAEPAIYQNQQGLTVAIDDCFVQFDNNGNLLEGGQKCDDVQLHEAKQAVQNYLRKQNSNNSETKAAIYQNEEGLTVAIDDCFVQFDNNGNLLEGGQKCDDVQLHEAKQAVQNYLRKR